MIFGQCFSCGLNMQIHREINSLAKVSGFNLLSDLCWTASSSAAMTYITDLLVLRQVHEHGHQVGLEVLHLHGLGKLSQLATSSPES